MSPPACWRNLLVVAALLVNHQLVPATALRGSSSSTPTPAPATEEEENHLFLSSSWDARCFQTTEELRDAVLRYKGQDSFDPEIAQVYGWPIGQWCVSNIYDFSNLFQHWHRDHPQQAHFNEPLGEWDMSLARDLSGMFQNCHEFHQDLSLWDVGEVTDMTRMFAAARNFNLDIGMWDTSQVRDMSYMFLHAHSFRGTNLNQWNIQSLKTTEGMFRDARSMDPSKLKWDLDTVPHTNRMFSDTPGVSMAADTMMPQNITETLQQEQQPAHPGIRMRDHHSSGLQIDPVKISNLLHP